jgi:hypothetical protein
MLRSISWSRASAWIISNSWSLVAWFKRELWTLADQALILVYSNDYRVLRGILNIPHIGWTWRCLGRHSLLLKLKSFLTWICTFWSRIWIFSWDFRCLIIISVLAISKWLRALVVLGFNWSHILCEILFIITATCDRLVCHTSLSSLGCHYFFYL